MKIETIEAGDTKIIGLSGEIDMHCSPELRKTLLETIEKKPPVLVVDLGDVTYIDSSGIATLVEGLKAMKRYGGKLRLVAINDNIMDLFRFAKLDRVFDTFSTVNSALKG